MIDTTLDPLAVLHDTYRDICARVDELEDELKEFEAKFETLKQMRAARTQLGRIVDPDGVPKRKRRSKAELEADRGEG